MKKIVFSLIAFLLFGLMSVNAQYRMKLHFTDGKISTISTATIDHIDWEEDTATYEDITIKGKTYHLGVSGAIDLGLSVRWATMNVGAAAPGDYGDYYAWGETEPYYTEGHSQDSPCTNWREGKTGYKPDSYFDFVNGSSSNCIKYAKDKKTKLDPEDDVAHVKWGSDWRIPTKAELGELREKCSWVWTTYGDHIGYVVIGSTGNAVFLPAAGIRRNRSLEFNGTYGYYWASSLRDTSMNTSVYAEIFYFKSDIAESDGNYRYYGLSIRPVCP